MSNKAGDVQATLTNGQIRRRHLRRRSPRRGGNVSVRRRLISIPSSSSNGLLVAVSKSRCSLASQCLYILSSTTTNSQRPDPATPAMIEKHTLLHGQQGIRFIRDPVARRCSPCLLPTETLVADGRVGRGGCASDFATTARGAGVFASRRTVGGQRRRRHERR
jgi:hypothetical protein